MAKVSVLIAARGAEPYLPATVEGLLEGARGEVEILVGLDGVTDLTALTLPRDRRVQVYAWEYAGLKPTINRLAGLAQGEFFLKTDAHCAFSAGWDELLTQECPDNWILIPRFYVLDAERWQWQDKRFYDYFMLDCPLTDPHGYRFRAGGHWPERTAERLEVTPIDESLSLHGSAWFTSRTHFLGHLGGMDPVGYGVMFMEPADLGLRTWLGPWQGKVCVRKDVWYAHMHKGSQRPRGFGVSLSNARRSYLWTANYWMRGAWPQLTRDMGWLIDRFWPVPTWPEDWRARQAAYVAEHPWDPSMAPAL